MKAREQTEIGGVAGESERDGLPALRPSDIDGVQRAWGVSLRPRDQLPRSHRSRVGGKSYEQLFKFVSDHHTAPNPLSPFSERGSVPQSVPQSGSRDPSRPSKRPGLDAKVEV